MVYSNRRQAACNLVPSLSPFRFLTFMRCGMKKKILGALVCCLLLMPLSPSAGWGRHHHWAGHSHHYHHGGAALAWGLSGLLLGSVLIASAYNPPMAVVYAPPPVYQPPVTTYAPAVPPGMCRWERYVLDQYGSVMYDRSGNPIKEYTLGSCQYPPY